MPRCAATFYAIEAEVRERGRRAREGGNCKCGLIYTHMYHMIYIYVHQKTVWERYICVGYLRHSKQS